MTREPHFLGTPSDELPDIERQPVHVVLDNIRSAFNVGSIFRTSDAGAVSQIWLSGMTAFPPNDRLSKTALGAEDYVPWTYRRKALSAVEELRAADVLVVAVELTDDAVDYREFQWQQPVALVFGHEVDGVRSEVLENCDAAVRIPMRGYKNTINVATAFGIVLFEVLRQWDRCVD